MDRYESVKSLIKLNMFFFDQLKNTFGKLFTTLSSAVDKLASKIFSKTPNNFDSEFVKVYNHNDFSYVFVDINKMNLLSEKEMNNLMNYIIESIKAHLSSKQSVLINIITKMVFKDQLNILYTHSLTYKLLFTSDDLAKWKTLLNRDIKELLNHYNDSQLIKIEFRFDYITPSDLK